MKKILVFAGVLLLLAGAGWWLLKKEVLKSPGFRPDPQKRQSALDLSPEVIARLQKMVHEGSDGLYKLEIGSLDIDVAKATVRLKAAKLSVDSAGYRRLLQAKGLPDDVYELDCRELAISGLGPGDLISRRDIAIKSIEALEPQLRLYHRRQPYNRSKRRAEQSQSLYDRMKPLFSSLSVDTIQISGGSYTDTDGDLGGKRQEFRNIALQAGGFRLSPETAADTSLFHFARSFRLRTTGYRSLIGDGDYDFGISAIELDACSRELTFTGLSLRPHGGRAAFERRQRSQTELYEIDLPQLRIRGFDWWTALHSEALLAEEVIANRAKIHIYLDLRLPQSGRVKRDNFPQQMLQQLGVPVSLRKVRAEAGHLSYEEMNEDVPATGVISFENFTATVENVTNLPAEVKAAPTATFRGQCLFMGQSRLEGIFTFRLPAASKGAFTMNISMGALPASALNAFAESMGLIRFTGGQLEQGSIRIGGNNDRITGSLTARYDGLKLAMLKTNGGKAYRQRPLMQFLANTVVKNSNPGRNGRQRSSTVDRSRSDEGNFFNFIWLAVKDGLMRLIR